MNNLVGVQIADTRDKLRADFLYLVDEDGPALFFEEDFHVFSVHHFHQNVELVSLGLGGVLLHEILVLDDVRVHEVLRYHELAVHLLQCFFGESGIVVDFASFINVLFPDSYDSDLVNVSLRPSAKLFHSLY